MQKYLICLLAFVILVLSLPGCTCRSNEIEVSLDERFSLCLGQTAVITGENLKIKFVEVLEDSRCPRNAQCIWAGEVIVAVEINDNGSLEKMVWTEPGLTYQPVEETYKEYQIAFHVEPYPELGNETPEEYRLQLIISK